ncbi:hypothetical protein ACNGQ9_00130 [Escherichia coli]
MEAGVANDKAVGWNSITLGDNDTGIKQGINVNYSFLYGQGSCPAAQPASGLIIKMAVYIHRSARDGYGFEDHW